MKKLRIYIISILALLTWAAPIWACGVWECQPSEYLLFRVADPADEGKGMLYIQPLAESDDPEVMRYLSIAKTCQTIRFYCEGDKWYYPTKEHNTVLSSLEDVLSECLAYKGEKLKDRYALQAARAMFTLGKFHQMLKWWEGIKDELRDETIKKSIEGYVAGALFRTGKQEAALRYYNEIGDISSIIFCLKKMGDYAGDRTLLEYAATHCPDDPSIIGILQEYITRVEYYGDFNERNGLVDACYDICMKAVKHSKKPAAWLYTAAFLKNQMGQPYVASNILARAEQCDASIFLKESIRVLRILIDAQIYPYNKAYENKLLGDLRWLDDKIQNNITENVINETASINRLKFGYSYYYWNDMMRKIVLGYVVPRMIEAGKIPLAVLLANYADNRLFMLVGKAEVWYGWESKYIHIDLSEYRKSHKYFNRYDFSNHYFRLLNILSLDNLLRYESLLFNPQSALEKFLQKGGYTDKEYHYDIVGTRMLRDLKYKEAVHYFSLISGDYQELLNTIVYMEFNPFRIEKEGYDNGNYKLNFARQMASYEETVQNNIDDNIKGEALIKMGLGLRSSFTFCWALTHYSKSEYNPWYEDKQTLDKIAYAHELIDKGLKMLKDSELAAGYYRDLYQWKHVVDNFPDTKVAEEIRTSCDNLVNYSYSPPEAQDTGCYVNLYCW